MSLNNEDINSENIAPPIAERNPPQHRLELASGLFGPDEARIKSSKILLIEDNAINIALAKELLRAHGYKGLDIISDPRNARAALEKNNYDLILLDINMPYIDGFEVIEIIHEVRGDEFLPILMMTAQHDRESRRRALKSGAHDYITKPYDHVECLHRINNLLFQRHLYLMQAGHAELLEEAVNERTSALAEATEEMERSRNFILNILDNVPDGILAMSHDGDVFSLNPAACTILDKSENDCLGHKIYDLFPSLPNEISCDAYACGEFIELDFTKENGRKKPLRLVFNADKESKEGNMVICLIHDLTLQKEAENAYNNLQNQLNVSQKMESLGRLAGGISHDFNNMLSIIRGYAQLSLRKKEDATRVENNMNAIIDATDRAAKLTHELLAFARSNPTCNLGVKNLNDIITEQKHLITAAVGKKVKIDYDISEIPSPILVDETMLGQAFLNLAINAKDALLEKDRPTDAPPPKISFTLKHDEDLPLHIYSKDQAPECGFVIVEISDNGTGMSDSIKKRIFEPLFTTKDKGKGTGLGLAQVYGIIQQSNGYIEVDSKEGVGTTFRIYLPIANEDVIQELGIEDTNSQKTSGKTRKLNILLAEDEDGLRDFVEEFLSDLGHNVTAAENGMDALDYFEDATEKFDLLLTDIVMPEMDGIKLTKLLQAAQPDLKILIMTGYPGKGGLEEAKLPKDIKVFLKPLNTEKLENEITQFAQEKNHEMQN